MPCNQSPGGGFPTPRRSGRQGNCSSQVGGGWNLFPSPRSWREGSPIPLPANSCRRGRVTCLRRPPCAGLGGEGVGTLPLPCPYFPPSCRFPTLPHPSPSQVGNEVTPPTTWGVRGIYFSSPKKHIRRGRCSAYLADGSWEQPCFQKLLIPGTIFLFISHSSVVQETCYLVKPRDFIKFP